MNYDVWKHFKRGFSSMGCKDIHFDLNMVSGFFILRFFDAFAAEFDDLEVKNSTFFYAEPDQGFDFVPAFVATSTGVDVQKT